ncbi:MAG: hypothetical protein IID61_08545, partial [SAR324 cluster bacterium]|nr:hypothetical protein [SAR324 cluster bacterium]
MQVDGLENPIHSSIDDDLDRFALVNRLYSLIVSIPGDWSVRIGLYAPWGQGKTSILNLLSERVSKDGHLVVRFSAWSAVSPDDCLALLYRALSHECKRNEICLPARRRMMACIGSFWRQCKAFLSRIQDWHPIAKVSIPIVAQILDKAFLANKAWFADVRKAIGGGRIIFLIDDLDRASPQVIPTLLLALREDLDLPGFAYVLAFDHEIISNALRRFNPAWGSGSLFLEKVIDIPVTVPDLDHVQCTRLFQRAAEKHLKFVAVDTLIVAENILPNSPRKLKLLVRLLLALKLDVARHYPHELDWIAIIHCLLLRIESESLFRDFADEIEEKSYEYLAQGGDEDKGAEVVENLVKRLAKKAGLSEEEIDRCKQIVESLFSSQTFFGGTNLLYQATFSDTPCAVTWKEFDQFFKKWNGVQSLDEVEAWCQQHAASVGRSIRAVVSGIFKATVNARQRHLEEAADATTAEENERIARKSIPYGYLLRQLLVDARDREFFAEIRTEQNLSSLFQSINRYFHFDANEADKVIREEEETLLREIVKRLVLRPQVLYKVLWSNSLRINESVLSSFYQELIHELNPALFEEGIQDFERAGAWKEAENDENRGVRAAILSMTSESDKARDRLKKIMSGANSSAKFHANVIGFVEFLLEARSGNHGREW